MKPSRYPWIVASVFLVALALAGLSASLAQAQKPIITTPTPTSSVPPRPDLPPGSGYAGPGVNWAWPLATGGMLAGDIPLEVPAEAFTYTVRTGDSLWSLAINFGRDLDTMACATRPRGDDAATLFPGQVVTIPALRDLCYTVTPYDTLPGIAARNGLTIEQITSMPWNELPQAPPYNIVPRQRILLPGVRMWAPPRPNREVIRGLISVPDDEWARSPWPEWPYGDGRFVWPVTGPVSQGAHAAHRAIDIAVPAGTPVRAADRGTVMMAGWSSVGYGFRVVIDHHIDYITLYAHLSDIYVQEGQVVAKGQIIGVTGANGNVTGPHLHFEIRDFGILTDPLTLLPQQ